MENFYMHHLWLLWLQTQFKLDLKGLIFKSSLSLMLLVNLNLHMEFKPYNENKNTGKGKFNQGSRFYNSRQVYSNQAHVFSTYTLGVLGQSLIQHFGSPYAHLVRTYQLCNNEGHTTLFCGAKEPIAIFVAKTTIQPGFVSIMIRDLTTLGLVKHHTLRCYLLHLFPFSVILSYKKDTTITFLIISSSNSAIIKLLIIISVSVTFYASYAHCAQYIISTINFLSNFISLAYWFKSHQSHNSWSK